MVVGFKGDSAKLKSLYKSLGLKEVRPNDFDELLDVIKKCDDSTVIANYNDIVVLDVPTADLIEKRVAVLDAVAKHKGNLFLSLTKNDRSIDKAHLDIKVCTSMKISDELLMGEIFTFVNTDLPYNGALNDEEYAVRVSGEERAKKRTLDELKKLIKTNSN